MPHVLSEAQVEQLLAAPDTSTPLGLRDRAMLELLYASGLRVSELVGLQLQHMDVQQGVVRVLGKGRKERLVPFGQVASDWLQCVFESKPAAQFWRVSAATIALSPSAVAPCRGPCFGCW